jgi:hypothetical protein
MASLIVMSLLFSGDMGLFSGDAGVGVSNASNEAPTAAEPSAGEVDDQPATPPTTAARQDVSSDASDITTTVVPLSELTADDVAEALAVSGFPDLEVVIDDAIVRLRGVVPDEVSRRAVLNQVGSVPGVEAVVDELEIG